MKAKAKSKSPKRVRRTGEARSQQLVGRRTGAAHEPEVERGAEWAERERWIRRFIGHFGEPGCLSEYRAHRITFRKLYDAGMRMAECMLAEAQSVHSCAFYGEVGGEEGDVNTEPRHSPTDQDQVMHGPEDVR